MLWTAHVSGVSDGQGADGQGVSVTGMEIREALTGKP